MPGPAGLEKETFFGSGERNIWLISLLFINLSIVPLEKEDSLQDVPSTVTHRKTCLSSHTPHEHRRICDRPLSIRKAMLAASPTGNNVWTAFLLIADHGRTPFGTVCVPHVCTAESALPIPV